MRRTIPVLSILLIVTSLAACSWKPSVTAVPITAPWSGMNLPVKENAVIWASTATEFKAVHKDDKKTVLGKYTDALKAQGWALDKYDDKSGDRYLVDMSKGADKVQVEVYNFENTGVIIKKV